ncbi:MAG: DegV family protein [Lachnospiraceae bacterium]|nr:DegV family protein [Lachnospiraceae bacterium]
MPKIAIVTDSNSGITQEDAKKYGIYVLPMPFEINGKTYYEDIDLTQDQFYEMLADPETQVHTSQPLPGEVMGLWDKLLMEYDEIVHIPMSSGLSGSLESAELFSKDYDGKVQVVDNQRISVTQKLSCMDALQMAEDGMDAARIRERLLETKADSNIYITVDTMTYLKKGGRVTPAAAAIAGVLNIKPVLRISGEKLDAFGKSRGMKAAKQVMIKAIRDDLEKNYGGINPDHPNAWIGMAYTHDKEAGLEFMEEVKKEFPGYHIFMDPLSLSVACHIGPGSLAVTTTRVLPDGMTYDKIRI